jgi:hypothetical protein
MGLEHFDEFQSEAETNKTSSEDNVNKIENLHKNSLNSRLIHPPSSQIFFLSIQYWFYYYYILRIFMFFFFFFVNMYSVESLCHLGRSEDAIILLSHYGNCFESIPSNNPSINEVESPTKNQTKTPYSNIFIEKTDFLPAALFCIILYLFFFLIYLLKWRVYIWRVRFIILIIIFS